MPIQIIRNDITKMAVDAIVNTSNSDLEPGGGVNGAIHKAAGPQLAGECRLLGGCKTGEAKLTHGYDLPAKYVIHTVGPVWHGGLFGEKAALMSCYRNALELARDKGCETIAFPLISAGTFGYPKKKALKTAMDVIGDFLLDNDMTVYLIVFNKECLNVSKSLFADVKEYIDEHYVEACEQDPYLSRARKIERKSAIPFTFPQEYQPSKVSESRAGYLAIEDVALDGSLDDWLNQIDESFSEMMVRKIKEKGMTNADCYKKANIDKKLFSKIKGNPQYKPKKANALAIAVALELTLDETKELLMKAGLALSHSDKFDLIVEYFILHGRYDIFEINEMLFHHDQPLLGGSLA